MPAIPAVLLERPGSVNWERQYEVCRTYVEKRGYEVQAKVDNDADAVALVRSGLADVVVAAFDTSDDAQLIADIQAVGGRLEYCLAPRQRRRRQAILAGPGHSTDELVVNAYDRGVPVEQIHAVLGTSLEKIRRIVARLRPRKPSDE